MGGKYSIRLIEEKDAEAALAVYSPFVLHTAITFEVEVPTASYFSERIKTNTEDYPWLVCLENEKIIGYAYGSKHRPKTAYQWSPESTIYLAPKAHGKGIGRVLYETLFAILKMQGYCNVFAGVSLPNEKSESFHRALGFECIGDFKNIGFKLGEWHSTRWFQLSLATHIDNPPAPTTMNEVEHSPDVKAILQAANEKVKLLS
jgi:L-amino acid N-acyltransferase YncA